MATIQLRHKLKIPSLLLLLLMGVYTGYFSWYTINRHNTLNSYAADLSLIDQPMWNTVIGPGGFMEQTWADRQQPRLAEHFEPILVPLALLFFLWDDVRILLIAQTGAIALGAIPVFWIAKEQLQLNSDNKTTDKTAWIALCFVAAYLLFPHLQAANIADFHADPFVVAPLLFAFWYASRQGWRWMWFWAIIAMLTKETLPPLTAMLGLYLILRFFWTNHTRTTNSSISNSISNSPLKHGAALIGVSTAWFLIATFLIVGPLARHYFGVDGPIYFASRFDGDLSALIEKLQDPARWQYVAGLFAAAGFLPLLAPELLLLGLPVLIANFFSNFPGQYSGEQHYSAPLVVAFVVAAVYGARRVVHRLSQQKAGAQPTQETILLATTLWLLGWVVAYHALYGWTPLAVRTEHYHMTPAAAEVPQLTAQIPADSPISASAGVHPHLAHRRVAYVFPYVEEASHLLVDVTDIGGVHPNDARAQIESLLDADFQLLQATQGLILAERSSPLISAPDQPACTGALPLPCAFYDFAHAAEPPTYATSLAFGDGRLRLTGYDLLDDPDDGVTVRFHWQTAGNLPEDLKLWPLIFDDTGQLLVDPVQTPMAASVWYPPSSWSTEHVIITETLPQLLPDCFHLGIAAGSEDSFGNPNRLYPIADNSDAGVKLHLENWAQLASLKRQGPFLRHLPPQPSLESLTPLNAPFGSSIRLTGYRVGPPSAAMLPVVLEWITSEPLPVDLTVFLHLLGPDGSLAAQNDQFPRWIMPQPTSAWVPDQPVLDSHTLELPPDLPLATYTLLIGLYDSQTMERLPLPDGSSALELARLELGGRSTSSRGQ